MTNKARIFYLSCVLLLVPTCVFGKQPPEIAPAFCQALVKHVPDPDVDYRPGVDVNGKPVTPADLPDTNTFQIQQPITIPLTADLFKFLNLPTTSFPYNTMTRTDIQLGTLTIDGDKVLYNGQPLTSEQQENLAVLCLKPTKNNDKNPPIKLNKTK